MKVTHERHLLVRDAQGVEVISTLPMGCRACALSSMDVEVTKSCGLPGRRRRGAIATNLGSVFLCSNDPDLLSSASLFKRELDFYVQSISRLDSFKAEISKAEAHKTRRLFHNLISLNAHALQELYSVVSQDRLGEFGGFNSQKEAISNFLKSKSEVSAELFLKSLKNAAAVKSELAVFQKLYDPSPALKFGNHEIHRVILNVANYFFQDFADQQIRLSIESSNVKLRLDYESMQVALYHILDNAVKYSIPSSEVRVTFKDDGDFVVCFEMTSLVVAEQERAKVLLDGFCGDQAKLLAKSGQGLGMGLIVDLLRLNNAVFEMTWGEPLQLASNMPISSPRYSQNCLAIRFPKESIVGKRAKSI